MDLLRNARSYVMYWDDDDDDDVCRCVHPRLQLLLVINNSAAATLLIIFHVQWNTSLSNVAKWFHEIWWENKNTAFDKMDKFQIQHGFRMCSLNGLSKLGNKIWYIAKGMLNSTQSINCSFWLMGSERMLGWLETTMWSIATSGLVGWGALKLNYVINGQ